MNKFKTAGQESALEYALRPGEGSDLIGTAGVDKIRRSQEAVRERKRALRQSARAVVRELVTLGQTQIVLNHIQPRWLRRAVLAKLNAGEEVTLDDLILMREAGRG